MFDDLSMQHFIIDGLEVTDRCWTPRSSDLTPLDFFHWGYMNDSVFVTPVNDIGELRTRIRDVIATITGEMLTRTFQQFEYRLDIVRATNVAHVEV